MIEKEKENRKNPLSRVASFLAYVFLSRTTTTATQRLRHTTWAKISTTAREAGTDWYSAHTNTNTDRQRHKLAHRLCEHSVSTTANWISRANQIQLTSGATRKKGTNSEQKEIGEIGEQRYCGTFGVLLCHYHHHHHRLAGKVNTHTPERHSPLSSVIRLFFFFFVCLPAVFFGVAVLISTRTRWARRARSVLTKNFAAWLSVPHSLLLLFLLHSSSLFSFLCIERWIVWSWGKLCALLLLLTGSQPGRYSWHLQCKLSLSLSLLVLCWKGIKCRVGVCTQTDTQTLLQLFSGVSIRR